MVMNKMDYVSVWTFSSVNSGESDYFYYKFFHILVKIYSKMTKDLRKFQ